MICMGVNDERLRRRRRTPSSPTRRAPPTASRRWPRCCNDALRHRAGPHHHGARLHERPAAAGPGHRDPQRQARPAPHARRRRCRSSRAPPARRGPSASCCPSSRASSTARRCGCPTPDRFDHRPRRRASREDVDVDEINAAFARSRATTSRTAACSSTRDEPLVSADIVGNPSSCIFSAARHDGERHAW